MAFGRGEPLDTWTLKQFPETWDIAPKLCCANSLSSGYNNGVTSLLLRVGVVPSFFQVHGEAPDLSGGLSPEPARPAALSQSFLRCGSAPLASGMTCSEPSPRPGALGEVPEQRAGSQGFVEDRGVNAQPSDFHFGV